MNYGKEAYYLATDLERRLGSAASFGVCGVPSAAECPSGVRTKIAGYSGGNALLIVSVTSEGAGGIEVYFGGLRVGGVMSGGTAMTVFAASGSGNVELLPAEGVTVSDAFVSAFGAECSFDDSVLPIAADSCGDAVAAATAEGGLSLYALTDGNFMRAFQFGTATDFDVAVSPAGTMAAMTDRRGNGALVLVADGECAASAVLPDCRLVSVTAEENGYLAAVYDGSRVTVTRYDGGLAPVESVTAHTSGTVTCVRFVKHAPSPCLAVSDNGKNFVRYSADEAFARIAPDATVTVTTAEEGV